MSLRPRFAGDGRLRLPASIGIVAETLGSSLAGDVVGVMGDATYDPFERVASGLLLAEEFARVDLSGWQAAANWHDSHGVVDLAHFLALGNSHFGPDLPEGEFHDHALEVLQQQENVRWHLLSLARLSDHLAASDDGGAWDPAWAQPAIQIGLDVVWLGGADDYERHIDAAMARHPEPQGTIPTGVGLDEYAEWWRRAHAAYARIVRDDVPVVWVPAPGMFTSWDREALTGTPFEHALTEGLSADWWGLVELERRLIAPYIARAGDHRVEIAPAADEAEPANGAEAGPRRGPLVVHERRDWSSLLAPVYVQLLEGLRRVTEGDRGAAFCKECGQPFLTLDARRSSFCTDRERFRYSQRERRRRLHAKARRDEPGTGANEPISTEATETDDEVPAELPEPNPWRQPHVVNQLQRRRRPR